MNGIRLAPSCLTQAGSLWRSLPDGSQGWDEANKKDIPIHLSSVDRILRQNRNQDDGEFEEFHSCFLILKYEGSKAGGVVVVGDSSFYTYARASVANVRVKKENG